MKSTNESEHSTSKGSEAPRSNFIRAMVDRDLASDKFQGRLVTRFPPEPNGYLHIGHAKSICLNFGLARDYGGACHLRFDDTNPTTEDIEFVESIQADIRWLGFDWGDNLFFASDYFEQLYQFAVRLITHGKAYVCSLSEEEIRTYRGSLSEPGRISPYAERSVEENLDLFERMRKGEFADGAHVLRARIDMAAANMKMRDPLLYRIRHAHHYRTGDAWCIYPMYDFAHCLSDAIERVTHSLCTLEFENNRELYDWVIREVAPDARPEQTEFARLGLDYTLMSKRKLIQLVADEHVTGWDDPRMWTLAGMRRRGYRPDAIRSFCDLIGVAKANSMVDMGKLEYAVRDDLNHIAPRVMCVLNPLKVVLTNYPEHQVEQLDASYFPHDVPLEGSRKVPFSRELYIERSDFMEDPPSKFYRLSPGREVRLRYGYVIRCDEVVRDESSGEISELRCTYDPQTRSGAAPDGRKIKGTVHWVSATDSLAAEVRLYDRLFSAEAPGAETGEWKDDLNPRSVQVLTGCRVEPSVAHNTPDTRYQFERTGYFWRDPVDSSPDGLVFNRIVALRDSWSKAQQKTTAPPTAKPAPAAKPASQKDDRKPRKRSRAEELEQLWSKHPELAARRDRYQQELGLGADDAQTLASDPEVADFFEEALATHDQPQLVANWVVNEVLRVSKESSLSSLAFGGTELGELTALIADETISGKIAKDVLDDMLKGDGSPKAIVERKGLRQITDPDAIAAVVNGVLEANPGQLAQYKAGKNQLFGFFVGQVMKETRGRANPRAVQQTVRKALDDAS